ncbi:MAG TPA: hypothetical protein VHR45_03175 [Thermoanaerobaculia bacterium]|nr:hypothetical protein [Thermoanaerobaculia bacterium]
MNRDHLLFATIGLLFGFISGYLLHEVMVARQPLRRTAGDAAAVAQVGPAAAPAEEGGSAAPGLPDGPASPTEATENTAGRPVGPGPAMAEIQQLRDYVAAHPKDADAVLKLANLNFDIHNWDRCRELYTQYLSLRPGDPDILTDLGITYRELHQFQSALDQFRRAEQVAPNHWHSVFNQVVVLGFDLKQYDAAERALARLRQLQPGRPEVGQLATALKSRRAAG